jgi:peptidyl-prolyl cis-trans isomerase D
MLQDLRDKTKTVVSYALLILLVISFGIWGIGDIFRGGFNKDWVAKIEDVKIHPNLLLRQFKGEVEQMRTLIGPSFTEAKARELGMVQRALDKLLTLTVFNLETSKLGLNVGQDEIIRTLESAKELRNPDGSFNRDMFKQILANQGMTEASFVDAQKQIVSRNLLIRGLSMPVTVPQTAIDDVAQAMAQKRVAELVRVNPDAIRDVDVSEADAKKYFEEHKDNYKNPEVRSFKVLAILPAEAGRDLPVSDEEVKAAYDSRKAEYDLPETRDVAQVVLDDEASAKEFIGAAMLSGLESSARAKGKEIAHLQGNSKADMPAELAEPVFAAGQGKISGPVQSGLGWHVFRVQRINPAKTVTFEEAKDELKAQMQKDKGAEHMVQTANKVDDMLAAGKSVDDIAAALSLQVQTYENREPGGRDVTGKQNDASKIPFGKDVLKAAFQYGEGETSPLIEAKEGGYLLVGVTKVTPAAVKEYAGVKELVMNDAVRVQRQRKATEAAKGVAEQLRAGKPLAEISGSGLIKKTSAAVLMDDTEQNDVPREALASLFDLKKGEVAVVSTKEGEIAVRVKDILPGEKDEIEKRAKGLKSKMTQEWTAVQLDNLTAALRKAYPATVDEAGIDRLIGSDVGP